MQVTVNHGKVKVEKLSNNTTLESIILTKGMRVRENLNHNNLVNTHSNIFTLDSNVNVDAVKWESGNLVFTNAPITDVINAIETRYGKEIQVNSTNVDLQFTGTFKNSDAFNTVIKPLKLP